MLLPAYLVSMVMLGYSDQSRACSVIMVDLSLLYFTVAHFCLFTGLMEPWSMELII